MDVSNAATRADRKAAYFLGIGAGILGFVLSLFEPKIHGLKLLAISLCASLAILVSVLKSRNLSRGTGWVFPATNSVLLWAVVLEIWLHLWLSR